MSALNHLKHTEEAFSTTDYDLDVAGTGKRIHLNHESMDVTIVGNFDVASFTMVPGFQHTGTWYDYFTGESFEVTDLNEPFFYEPGEYHIYTDQFLETPDIDTHVAEREKSAHAVVWPNPADQQLNIVLDRSWDNDVRIELLDLQGRTVGLIAERQTEHNNQLTWNIPQNLPNGMYVLHIQSNRHSETIRVVIE
jgi:hypothetical protein